MARQSYDLSLRRLLTHEGGYTNHPSDPGGPTNYGITIHDYRRYINSKGTSRDVRDMSVHDAKKIYRARYWDVQRCDELPPGVDYAIFDYGVNSGIGRSGKVLRRLVGLSDSTHKITDQVIAATAKRDPVALVDAICAERLRYVKKLRTWPVFGRGWQRRISEVRAAARAMAMDHYSDMPDQTTGIEGSSRSKDDNPLARYGTAILAAGSTSAMAVYSWAVENPLMAAVIIQGAIALAVMIVRAFDESAKPQPVPEAFDMTDDPLGPHISDEPSAPMETLEAELEPVITPPPQPDPMLAELGAPITIHSLIHNTTEAKPLQKPGE